MLQGSHLWKGLEESHLRTSMLVNCGNVNSPNAESDREAAHGWCRPSRTVIKNECDWVEMSMNNLEWNGRKMQTEIKSSRRGEERE